MRRRPDHRVGGHGVAAGVVQVVGPLVDFIGAGLHGFLPPVVLLHVGRATRSKHTQALLDRNPARVLRHEQVDEVVGVGQFGPGQPVDRHLAIEAEGPDVLACGGHVFRARIEPVDEIGVARPQSGGEPAVAATEMHDQAAPDTGGCEDLPGVFRTGDGGKREAYGERRDAEPVHQQILLVLDCVPSGLPQ